MFVILDCLLHQPRLIPVGYAKRSPGLLYNAFLDVECDVPVMSPRDLDQIDRTIIISNLTQSGRYLTSGSLHRTRQDKGTHMLSVITVKLSFITQFHPHHLDIPRFFPKDPQNNWGPQNNKIGISLVELKYPLKTREDLDQIFHSLSLTHFCACEDRCWT